MKGNVIIVLGFLAALLLLVDITRSLSQMGPRCDECGGSLVVVGNIQDEFKEFAYFRCEGCRKYSVVVEELRDSH